MDFKRYNFDSSSSGRSARRQRCGGMNNNSHGQQRATHRDTGSMLRLTTGVWRRSRRTTLPQTTNVSTSTPSRGAATWRC